MFHQTVTQCKISHSGAKCKVSDGLVQSGLSGGEEGSGGKSVV